MAKTSEKYREANQKVIRLSAAFVPLIRMLILVGFIGILIFAGLQTLEGTMAVGLYSVLIFVTQRLLWPLTRLGETFEIGRASCRERVEGRVVTGDVYA